MLKKPRFSSKRHRGLTARATNASKNETYAGRAILPADFFNSLLSLFSHFPSAARQLSVAAPACRIIPCATDMRDGPRGEPPR